MLKKCRKPLFTLGFLGTTYSFGVTWAPLINKKMIFFSRIIICLFFVIKVVSMEVVQDFVNSPSLEKFKNIPSPQRKSLLAEYFKVCNIIWYTIVYWLTASFVN